MGKKLFILFSALVVLAGIIAAQDAKTVLQNATQAMGNVKCASSEGWHEQWVRVPPG